MHYGEVKKNLKVYDPFRFLRFHSLQSTHISLRTRCGPGSVLGAGGTRWARQRFCPDGVWGRDCGKMQGNGKRTGRRRSHFEGQSGERAQPWAQLGLRPEQRQGAGASRLPSLSIRSSRSWGEARLQGGTSTVSLSTKDGNGFVSSSEKIQVQLSFREFLPWSWVLNYGLAKAQKKSRRRFCWTEGERVGWLKCSVNRLTPPGVSCL